MSNRYLKKEDASRGFEIEDSIMTVAEKEDAVIETRYEHHGLKILFVLTLLLIIVLFGRVFQLDFIQGKYYKDLAKGNRIRSLIINAPRGKILDRNGSILVRNIPSIDLVVIPNKIPEDSSERKKMAEKLSKILNMDRGNVEVILESQDRSSIDPILVKENVSEEESLIFLENQKELAGAYLENTAIRNYENSTIFSSIMGYDGKITREELKANPDYRMTDYIGKTGLEKQYEKELRGVAGARQVEVDSVEKVKKELGIKNPIIGNDLVLNVDEGLQKKIYDSIAVNLEQTNTSVAAVVAIDPRTGGILAMVSFPSYDNNLFAGGISNEDYKNIIENPDLPLFNRVVGGEYPPGSTIKPIIATGALTEGTINENTTVGCYGGITLGAWHFGDWKNHGRNLNVRESIAESCDVFFYAIGGGYGNVSGLGMDKMKKYYELFGFGNETGIDFPGEANGLIPSPNWKENVIQERWYIGNSYHASIGQGYVRATPIQLASYTAAIANGGKLYSPRIVNKIKRPDGSEKKISAEVIRKNFIPKDVLKIVQEGMRQTVTSGTATYLNDLEVEVAGKTGTAEFGSEKGKAHSWFVSYAPYDDPEIAMVVLVEGGGETSSKSVPITKDVYKWYFQERQ